MKIMYLKSLLLTASLASAVIASADEIALSSMDLSKITCFTGDNKVAVRANKSTSGNPITLKGTVYESGVGTHAPSKTIVALNGTTAFSCVLGVDDEAEQLANHGIVDYTVTLYKDKTPEVRYNGQAKRTDTEAVNVNLTDLGDFDYLMIDFENAGVAWADHCDIANAYFTYTGKAPATVTEEEMYPDPDAPAIIELPAAGENGEEIIPLSSLDLTLCTNGWGTIKANKSIDGNTLTINGQQYASGVGMHATGKVVVKLNGAVTAFHGVIGIDDEILKSNYGSGARCNYKVALRKQNGEEQTISSGEISAAEKKIANIDITSSLGDYKYLIIDLNEGANNSYDHVDIANAYFEYVEQNSTRPEMVNENVLSSKLACATTVFSQPGVKFMHKLRSNNPDIEITVKDLPQGLTFNASRKLVEGIIETEGNYTYTAVVTNGDETEEVAISLTVSANLQQPVPHMGWLSWNVVQGDISEEVVRQATDNMVATGLRDAGYNYVMMDDLWHGTRNESTGKPQPNATRFPNGIKPVADYVHANGMKFGLYSDAAERTCARAFGSYGYEEIDAKQYAEWTMDYVKYDYCGAPSDLESAKARYLAMGQALQNTGRNMVFNICEWGVRSPWDWGAECLGSSWRVTYDVRDGWNCRNGGIGMIQSVELMKDLWVYNGVNRWNDADMLCVGINGTGKSSSDLVVGTPGMTKTEYKSQFAMWCMWSSPLSLSFDIRKPISDEDLAIMTNPEMIALDQDRMGQAAEYLGVDGNQCYLFAKDLENGDVAIAVINMDSADHTYNIDFAAIPALDPMAKYSVRDVQNLVDLPDATAEIANLGVASHETRVLRLHNRASDDQTAIEAIAAGALEQLTTSVADNTLTVCLPNTEGVSKRFLISDTAGHIVGAQTSSAACVNIPLREGTHGVYIVNVTSAARTYASKVVL